MKVVEANIKYLLKQYQRSFLPALKQRLSHSVNVVNKRNTTEKAPGNEQEAAAILNSFKNPPRFKARRKLKFGRKVQ